MTQHLHNNGPSPRRSGSRRVVAIALLTLGIIGGATCAQTWQERRQQRVARRKAFWAKTLQGNKGPKVESPTEGDRLPKAKHAVGYTVLTMPSSNHEGRSVTVNVAVWFFSKQQNRCILE